MSAMSDQNYLLSKQYTTSTNLQARIQLHDRFSTNPIDWQHWVFDQLAIPAHSRMLELGSGSGQLWRKNMERIPATWDITLSDFSSGMLEDCRQNLSTGNRKFQFAVIDAQSIPYEDNTFDAVIANHMLYHVPDCARALAEIRRVLSPEGRFYAATNGTRHLQEIKQLCERAGIVDSGILNGNASGRSGFSMQNGAEQMAPLFAHIDLIPMENNLAVTEAEPLIAFILSCVPPDSINDTQLTTLRTIIDQELAEHQAIHITKETGLFITYGDVA